MPETKHSDSTMKIARLGECTNLWSELIKYPQCVIGGFDLNLAELRRISGDNATLSVAMEKFLDGCLYVADDSKNPYKLSISELYNANEKVDVIFDPLRSVELDWIELENLMRRQDDQDENRSINYAEMLNQMETRMALFANRPLQRKLIIRLKVKQKEYTRGWVHFRRRIQDFWKLAYEVCLDQPSDPSLAVTPSQKELAAAGAAQTMLDWIFLTNANNRMAYQNLLYDHFETKLYLTRTLKDIYAMLDKMNTILGPDSRGKKRPPRYKDVINDAIAVISERWFTIWPETYQPLLDTPLAEDFRENMKVIEGRILDEFSPNRFVIGKQRIAQSAASQTLTELRDLVWAALESWQLLVNKQPKTNTPVDREVHHLKAELDKLITAMNKSVIDVSGENGELSDNKDDENSPKEY